jgi:putative FmdB family regulatory protein
MPIYAYKCESCGHRQDVLQKLSDDPLTICPACQAPAFEKQVTAAGFQLKGSGWYQTDFRNTGSAPAAKDGNAGAAPGPAADAAAPAAASPSPAASPAASPNPMPPPAAA